LEQSGRSRSSRTDGAKTKARILEVSLPLFAELGYAGTSIRRIADAADCNVATLAYHFKDKQGLYSMVVQRLHAELSQGVPDVSSVAAGTPDELIDHYVKLLWDFANQHRVHMRLAVRHLLDQGAHPDVVMDNWAESLMARADLLIAMFRPEWPSAQRRLLVSSMQHLFVRFAIEDRAQLSVILGHPEDLDLSVRIWFGGMIRRELGLSQ